MEERAKTDAIRFCGEVLASILGNKDALEKCKGLRTRARSGASQFMLYGYKGFMLFLLYKADPKKLFDIYKLLKQGNYVQAAKQDTKENYALYFALLLYILSKFNTIKLDAVNNIEQFYRQLTDQLFDERKEPELERCTAEAVIIMKYVFGSLPSK
ncbi:MAG: hypothetical protein GXO42_00725 [bacterium]|nr:hypothetical protein [bacterium]